MQNWNFIRLILISLMKLKFLSYWSKIAKLIQLTVLINYWSTAWASKILIQFVRFSDKYTLTLKWPRYFYSRWCPRGFHGPEKTTFPPEFCNEICTIYVRDIKNHNSAKKIFKCCTVSKWRPNNRFLFRLISILAKLSKTTFPKEFFNEIWLKEGEY